MTEIPKATIADIARWFELQRQLGELKSQEAMLRSRIFKDFFPDAEEGTNNHPLNDGTGAVLKGTRVISRAVDDGELEALGKAIRDPGANLPKLPLAKLVKWKPELVVKEYRALSEDDRLVFDRCLIIKDGSPQMKVEIPKRATP